MRAIGDTETIDGRVGGRKCLLLENGQFGAPMTIVEQADQAPTALADRKVAAPPAAASAPPYGQ